MDKGRTGSSVAQGGVELQGSRGRVHADPTRARQPRVSGDRQSDKQETTSGPPPQTSRLPAATVCSFCELLRVRQSPRGGASAASETCQPVTHCRARELGKCGDSGPESRCREHCVSVGHSASRPFSRGIFTPRKSTDGLELYQKKHVISTLLGSAPEACELNRQKTD